MVNAKNEQPTGLILVQIPKNVKSWFLQQGLYESTPLLITTPLMVWDYKKSAIRIDVLCTKSMILKD